MKLTIFALMLATANPSTAGIDNSIVINKVGTFKFAVSTSAKEVANVIITDVNNTVIHQEYVTNSKLFNFDQLADGEFKMTVLNSYKKVVKTKLFKINTQVKKDLVTIQ
jgi:hypothetical protein